MEYDKLVGSYCSSNFTLSIIFTVMSTVDILVYVPVSIAGIKMWLFLKFLL